MLTKIEGKYSKRHQWCMTSGRKQTLTYSVFKVYSYGHLPVIGQKPGNMGFNSGGNQEATRTEILFRGTSDQKKPELWFQSTLLFWLDVQQPIQTIRGRWCCWFTIHLTMDSTKRDNLQQGCSKYPQIRFGGR